MAKYLVIDNGGTFIKPSLMDGEGNILEMLPKIPTNSLNTAAMAERSAGKDISIEGELE